MSVRENEVVRNEHLDVWGRAKTYDFKSASECSTIINHLRVKDTDTVLDIGGHIGAFARLCAKTGAKTISVEPELTNAEIHRRNTSEFPNVELHVAAVVADDYPEDSVNLYIRGRTHTGLHTIIKGATKQTSTGFIIVPVLRFNALIADTQPTVLKVDIEGGEWFFDWTRLPNCITRMHIEMHMRLPVGSKGRERGPIVHQQILDQGFTALVPPRFNTLYGTRPYYERS